MRAPVQRTESMRRLPRPQLDAQSRMFLVDRLWRAYHSLRISTLSEPAACSGVARAVVHGDALIRKGIAAVGEAASTCYTIRTRGGSPRLLR